MGVIFFIVRSQSSDQSASSKKETKKTYVRYDDLEAEKAEDNGKVQSETDDSEQSDDEGNEQISKEDTEQDLEQKQEKTESSKSVKDESEDKSDDEDSFEQISGEEDEKSQTTNSNSIFDYESNQSDSQDSEQSSNENQEQPVKPRPEQTPDEENKEPEGQQPEEPKPEKPSEQEKEEVDENANRIEQAVQNGFPVIVVSNEKAKPGDKIVVTATLVNNPGILGTSVTLSYDDSVMSLVSAKSGEAFSDVLTMSHSKKLESGCVFLWDGENLADDEILDGTILTLEFQISKSAPAGKTPVMLINAEDSTVDRDLQSVKLVSENGFITIAE